MKVAVRMPHPVWSVVVTDLTGWMLSTRNGSWLPRSVADAESKLREAFLLVGGDAGVRVAQIKANPAAFTDDQSPVGKALAEALLELAKTESKIASERQARKE